MFSVECFSDLIWSKHCEHRCLFFPMSKLEQDSREINLYVCTASCWATQTCTNQIQISNLAGEHAETGLVFRTDPQDPASTDHHLTVKHFNVVTVRLFLSHLLKVTTFFPPHYPTSLFSSKRISNLVKFPLIPTGFCRVNWFLSTDGLRQQLWCLSVFWVHWCFLRSTCWPHMHVPASLPLTLPYSQSRISAAANTDSDWLVHWSGHDRRPIVSS